MDLKETVQDILLITIMKIMQQQADKKEGMIRVSGVVWFTNLEISINEMKI